MTDLKQAPDVAAGETTRDRILDIALELFSAQGYEKTSLRQIADKLGFSKAAIYYHFASKEDILRALHMRLHEFGRSALETLGQTETNAKTWAALLDQLIDQILANRALFLLHERNQAAFESLHNKEHEDDHFDLGEKLKEALSDSRLPLRTRVRMSCAFAAVTMGVLFSGDVFADVPNATLGELLRGAVDDLLSTESGDRAV